MEDITKKDTKPESADIHALEDENTIKKDHNHSGEDAKEISDDDDHIHEPEE